MCCTCIEFLLPLETVLETVKDCIQRKDAGKDLLWNIVGRKPYVGICRPDRPCDLGYVPKWSKASIDDPQTDGNQHKQKQDFQPIAIDQKLLKHRFGGRVCIPGKPLDLDVDRAVSDLRPVYGSKNVVRLTLVGVVFIDLV